MRFNQIKIDKNFPNKSAPADGADTLNCQLRFRFTQEPRWTRFWETNENKWRAKVYSRSNWASAGFSLFSLPFPNGILLDLWQCWPVAAVLLSITSLLTLCLPESGESRAELLDWGVEWCEWWWWEWLVEWWCWCVEEDEDWCECRWCDEWWLWCSALGAFWCFCFWCCLSKACSCFNCSRFGTEAGSGIGWAGLSATGCWLLAGLLGWWCWCELEVADEVRGACLLAELPALEWCDGDFAGLLPAACCCWACTPLEELTFRATWLLLDWPLFKLLLFASGWLVATVGFASAACLAAWWWWWFGAVLDFFSRIASCPLDDEQHWIRSQQEAQSTTFAAKFGGNPDWSARLPFVGCWFADWLICLFGKCLCFAQAEPALP